MTPTKLFSKARIELIRSKKKKYKATVKEDKCKHQFLD